MKTIAFDALGAERPGQGKKLGDVRLRAMESGIETADLRYLRQPCGKGADAGQVMRLVQGSQYDELFEFGEHLRRQYHRLRIEFATMHDTVADRADFPVVLVVSTEPAQ